MLRRVLLILSVVGLVLSVGLCAASYSFRIEHTFDTSSSWTTVNLSNGMLSWFGGQGDLSANTAVRNMRAWWFALSFGCLLALVLFSKQVFGVLAVAGSAGVMRRMLLTLGIVGLAGSAGLWGMSYFNIEYIPTSRTAQVILAGGAVFTRIQHPQSGMVHGTVGLQCHGFDSLSTWWREPAGDSRYLLWKDHPSARRARIVFVPLWAPTMLFTAACVFMMVSIIMSRHRLRRLGLCVACCYDLRGSPGACPECGHVRE
jgi:hypothetical protein